MIKVILIAMLMNLATGEVSHVQQPLGYASLEQCHRAAELLTSTQDGWAVRAYCVAPSDLSNQAN